MRIALLIVTLACGPVYAQTMPATQPATQPANPYRIVRHTEDFSFLARPDARHSWLDPIKYIRLSDRDDVYLTLGGEARYTYEFFDNNAFGAGPQDGNGFHLQRYMLHADLHVTDAFRAFVDVKSALEDGRKGGPRPPDEDVLDLHQAFFDIGGGDPSDLRLTLRAGRQELLYGSARLIGHRLGPNVRQSFDGVKLISNVGPTQIDAFFARPVETDPGVFDDGSDDSRSLWAVYGTTPVRSMNGGIDLYYIGFRNEQARFVQGTGKETRHTVGTRLFGKQQGFDWNWEFMGQFGDYDGADILAWSIGTETGYTFAAAPTRPRLGLRANVISGDTDPTDDTLGTFNALFPRGGYFGEAGVVGPSNIFNLHPQLDLHLRRDLTLTFDTVFFWRYSLDDGIYNPAAVPIRFPNASDERYIGTQPSVILSYRPTQQLTLIGTYTAFIPGSFIEESGPSETIQFVRFEMQFRF